MKQPLRCTLSALLESVLPLATGAQTITATTTFHNIGVEVAFATASPAGTTMGMAIRKQGESGPYRPIHDLSRISDTRFAGSALELEPGTTYSIQLQSAVFGSDQFGTASTREDGFPEATDHAYHVAPGGDDGNGGSNLYSSDLDGPTKNLDFHHNTISGCRDDAVETDGAGSNNRIYRNTFHDFLTGVSVAPCAIGPTYVFRNVFSGWHSVDGYEGYPFKFNVSSSLPIRWVYLYHNTCNSGSMG